MKKLMAIFAHPDDEGAIGGTLAHYAQNGVEVMLVCATRGEVGEISDPALATRETIGQVREMELEAASAALGIQQLRFLDKRDSGMDGTPENEDERALVQGDEAEMVGQLVGMMRAFEPDVVVTFEPFGWYGHPDHRIMSKWVTAAFSQLYHHSIDKKWQSRTLFHAVLPFSKFGPVVEAAVEAGYLEEAPFAEMPMEPVQAAEASITHEIAVDHLYDIKDASMMSHKTQFGEDNMFRKIPREMILQMWGHEYFAQVLPAPSTDATEKPNDLFVTL